MLDANLKTIPDIYGTSEAWNSVDNIQRQRILTGRDNPYNPDKGRCNMADKEKMAFEFTTKDMLRILLATQNEHEKRINRLEMDEIKRPISPPEHFDCAVPTRSYTKVGDSAENIPDIDGKRAMIEDNALDVMTVQEAATYLQISKTTVNRLLATDAIRGSRIGNQWRFAKQALLDWINDGMSKSTGQGKQMELKDGE